MKRLCHKIAAFAVAVGVVSFAFLPTVVYLLYSTSFDLSVLANSTCDAVFSINVTRFIGLTGRDPNSAIAKAIASELGESLDISPLEMRKVMEVLGVSDWPLPPNISFSNTQVSNLYRLFSTGSLLEPGDNLTCHKDLTSDLERGCCFFLCSTWEWQTGTRLTASLVLFFIELCLGLLALIATTVIIVTLKTERKFPHLMIVWYSLVCLVYPTVAEAVSRIIGFERSVCCGKEDALEALASPDCTYRTVYCTINQFTYHAAAFWTFFGLFDLWLTIGIGRGDCLIRENKKMHLIQSALVWGSSAVLAVIPYSVDKDSAYRNIFLSYSCEPGSRTMQYFTSALPLQICLGLAGLCLVHLTYVLKKWSFKRKKLMAEGAGTSINRTGVRQLQTIESRFLLLMVILFAASLCLVIEYIVFAFVKQNLDVQQILQEYVFCVLLKPEASCVLDPKIGELLFIHTTFYRVVNILYFVWQFFFFCISKDVKRIWRKALTVCCEKKKTRMNKESYILDSCQVDTIDST
eukprot:m.137184 g.137184  ORF g.137184 m.137184 type:complete len:520 (+) comp38210_c0_seq7:65-1624(+)